MLETTPLTPEVTETNAEAPKPRVVYELGGAAVVAAAVAAEQQRRYPTRTEYYRRRFGRRAFLGSDAA